MSNNLKTCFQAKKKLLSIYYNTDLTYTKINNFRDGGIIPDLYIIEFERVHAND